MSFEINRMSKAIASETFEVPGELSRDEMESFILTEAETDPIPFKISPSSAFRWMSCAGSPKLITSLGKSKYIPSVFSAEGKVVHKIVEDCIKKDLKPSSFINKEFTEDGFLIKITQTMVDSAAMYLGHILPKILKSDTWGIEEKLDLKILSLKGMSVGYVDFTCTIGTTLYIDDFKNGTGVTVGVEENAQLMIYALALIFKLKYNHIQNIRITIIQPNTLNREEQITYHDLSKKELEQWYLNVLKPAAELCQTQDAPLKASISNCRFCPVKDCLVKYKECMSEMPMDDGLKLPNLTRMTVAQKIKILDNADLIKNLLKTVQEQVKSEIENGSSDYEGSYKLVRSVTRRVMSDEAYCEMFSPLLDHIDEEDLFDKKPKGIGAIEKALKAKGLTSEEIKVILKPLVTKPKGYPTMVSESDRRTAISSSKSISNDFIENIKND